MQLPPEAMLLSSQPLHELFLLPFFLLTVLPLSLLPAWLSLTQYLGFTPGVTHLESPSDSQAGSGSLLCYEIIFIYAWHLPSRPCNRPTIVRVMRNLGSKSHLLGLLWDGMGLSHIHDGEARSTGQGGPSVTSYLEADSDTSEQIPRCQVEQGA